MSRVRVIRDATKEHPGFHFGHVAYKLQTCRVVRVYVHAYHPHVSYQFAPFASEETRGNAGFGDRCSRIRSRNQFLCLWRSIFLESPNIQPCLPPSNYRSVKSILWETANNFTSLSFHSISLVPSSIVGKSMVQRIDSSCPCSGGKMRFYVSFARAESIEEFTVADV